MSKAECEVNIGIILSLVVRRPRFNCELHLLRRPCHGAEFSFAYDCLREVQRNLVFRIEVFSSRAEQKYGVFFHQLFFVDQLQLVWVTSLNCLLVFAFVAVLLQFKAQEFSLDFGRVESNVKNCDFLLLVHALCKHFQREICNRLDWEGVESVEVGVDQMKEVFRISVQVVLFVVALRQQFDVFGCAGVEYLHHGVCRDKAGFSDDYIVSRHNHFLSTNLNLEFMLSFFGQQNLA